MRKKKHIINRSFFYSTRCHPIPSRPINPSVYLDVSARHTPRNGREGFELLPRQLLGVNGEHFAPSAGVGEPEPNRQLETAARRDARERKPIAPAAAAAAAAAVEDMGDVRRHRVARGLGRKETAISLSGPPRLVMYGEVCIKTASFQTSRRRSSNV